MMITSRRSVRLMGWLAISNWSRIRPASKLSRQATTLTLRPSGGAGAGRSVKVEEQSSRTKSWTKWHSHRIMPLTGVASHTRSSITINSAVSNSFNLRRLQQCCAVSFSQLLSNAVQISFFCTLQGTWSQSSSKSYIDEPFRSKLAWRMVQNCVNIFEISFYIILIKWQSKTEDNKKVNNDSVSVL